jgi:hypothetical protein
LPLAPCPSPLFINAVQAEDKVERGKAQEESNVKSSVFVRPNVLPNWIAFTFAF